MGFGAKNLLFRQHFFISCFSVRPEPKKRLAEFLQKSRISGLDRPLHFLLFREARTQKAVSRVPAEKQNLLFRPTDRPLFQRNQTTKSKVVATMCPNHCY